MSSCLITKTPNRVFMQIFFNLCRWKPHRDQTFLQHHRKNKSRGPIFRWWCHWSPWHFLLSLCFILMITTFRSQKPEPLDNRLRTMNFKFSPLRFMPHNKCTTVFISESFQGLNSLVEAQKTTKIEKEEFVNTFEFNLVTRLPFGWREKKHSFKLTIKDCECGEPRELLRAGTSRSFKENV